MSLTLKGKLLMGPSTK